MGGKQTLEPVTPTLLASKLCFPTLINMRIKLPRGYQDLLLTPSGAKDGQVFFSRLLGPGMATGNSFRDNHMHHLVLGGKECTVFIILQF